MQQLSVKLFQAWKPGSIVLVCFVTVALFWTPIWASDLNYNSTSEAKGIVHSTPDGEWQGIWIIGDEEYRVNESTRIHQKEGPLVMGACVEIKFETNSDPYLLSKIETEEADECEKENDDEEIDEKNDGEEEEDKGTATFPKARIYGRIAELPEADDLTGIWRIENMIYNVTAETKLDRDHGDFETGACVEVQYNVAQDGMRTALKIETEHEFKCTKNENERPHGQLFGVIHSLPDDWIGEWNIGDKTFLADEETQFKEKRHLSFAKGVVVKVKFTEQIDGTLRAQKIQAKFRLPWYDSADEPDESDENTTEEGLHGHLFGEIERYPSDLIGEWVASGISFTTTSETSYIQRFAAFDVGVPVRVDYTVDANGDRVAGQVKVRRSRGNSSHKFCGFVRLRPAGGFLGRWDIGSFAGVANVNTEYDESLGLIGQHAYVEVDYTVDQSGRVTYLKIKSHVPPGGGENDASGIIHRFENSVQAATVSSEEKWVIGGITYTVTSATELEEADGQLEVGTLVAVNSYTAEDGTEVATRIRAITTEPAIFLPLTQW